MAKRGYLEYGEAFAEQVMSGLFKSSHEQRPEESMLSRFQTIRADALPGCSLCQTGGSDILLERIVSLYFPAIQISLDTKSHILQDQRQTSPQVRGSRPPREDSDADISTMGDVLVSQSVSASLEVRSISQSETLRGFELRVVPDFYDYCLEVLDRLTKN